MALNGLFCADVPLRNYSLSQRERERERGVYQSACRISCSGSVDRMSRNGGSVVPRIASRCSWIAGVYSATAAAAAAAADDDDDGAHTRAVLRTECALPASVTTSCLGDVQRTSSDRSRRPKMSVRAYVSWWCCYYYYNYYYTTDTAAAVVVVLGTEYACDEKMGELSSTDHRTYTANVYSPKFNYFGDVQRTSSDRSWRPVMAVRVCCCCCCCCWSQSSYDNAAERRRQRCKERCWTLPNVQTYCLHVELCLQKATCRPSSRSRELMNVDKVSTCRTFLSTQCRSNDRRPLIYWIHVSNGWTCSTSG